MRTMYRTTVWICVFVSLCLSVSSPHLEYKDHHSSLDVHSPIKVRPVPDSGNDAFSAVMTANTHYIVTPTSLTTTILLLLIVLLLVFLAPGPSQAAPQGMIHDVTGSARKSRLETSISPRVRFIAAAVFIVVALAGIIIGLTIGLRTGPKPRGGSPTFPPPQGPGDGKYTTTTAPGDGPKSASGDFRFSAVQTHTDICSKVGTSVLARHGGNAVDAAVAAILCVGVVNAHSAGIGGGFFMTLYSAPQGSTVKEANTIIAREVAPLSATQDMFVNSTGDSTTGGRAIAVPGEISGLYRAWQLYGRVPWKLLVEPTARLLEEGFPVEGALASAIEGKLEIIKEKPLFSKVFLHADGTPLRVGDIFKDPVLAKTFRTISEDPLSFYNGSLAADIVQDIKDQGGNITLHDLSRYKARVRAPVTSSLQRLNMTLLTGETPTSGLVLQYILRLCDRIGVNEESLRDTESSVLTYHRLAEIFKFAYGKRSALGDADFVDMTEVMANMTSDDYIDQIQALINDSYTQDLSYYGPAFEIHDSGTAHITVMAPDGSAVALTSTINHHFGAKVRGERTGIIFNNEMDDFSTPGTINGFGVPASPSNYIQPGKMPMSSMAPAIVLDKDNHVVMAGGGTGGTKITSSTAYVMLHHLYIKKDLREATDMPRLHHQLLPNYIQYEPHMDPAILEGLKAKGHDLRENNAIARVGSLRSDCGAPCTGSSCYSRTCLSAVSDGRKGGSPDGY